MNKGAYGINAPGGVRETVYVPLSTATVITLVHNMGRAPDIVNIVYLCTTIDNGWQPGQEAVVCCNSGIDAVSGICAVSDRSTIKTHNLSSTNLYLPLPTSGISFFMVTSRWKVKLKAIWFAPV